MDGREREREQLQVRFEGAVFGGGAGDSLTGTGGSDKAGKATATATTHIEPAMYWNLRVIHCSIITSNYMYIR
jgi:hypothetical protein